MRVCAEHVSVRACAEHVRVRAWRVCVYMYEFERRRVPWNGTCSLFIHTHGSGDGYEYSVMAVVPGWPTFQRVAMAASSS